MRVQVRSPIQWRDPLGDRPPIGYQPPVVVHVPGRTSLFRLAVYFTIGAILVHHGLTGRWFPDMFGLAAYECGPSEPVTVSDITYGMGERLTALMETPPEVIAAEVEETIEMLGVAVGSFRLGVEGKPKPERLNQWEAQAVNAAYGQSCLPTPQEPQGPILVDYPAGEPGPWGGHRNGRIPASALCEVGHTAARCDAAAAFEQMSAAYARTFGSPITVTDGYRDYAGQIACERAKGSSRTGGGLCAVPGTSNHGWGLAFDLGGGIQRFGTDQHEWMRTHAVAYGFTHPEWAQRGGSKPEPWHWEFSQPVSAG